MPLREQFPLGRPSDSSRPQPRASARLPDGASWLGIPWSRCRL